METSVLKQGAEGRLYLSEWQDKKCLVKERFQKKYRHPDLDAQITRQRMKAESKAVARCQSAGILAPQIYQVNFNERKLYMQYFEHAITSKEYIRQSLLSDRVHSLLDVVCSRIGAIIGQMHSSHIIHGDLTTSNILINPVNADNPGIMDQYEVIFIDFGLSFYSENNEDKGVDLYVLERALLSTHSELPELFDMMLKAYCKQIGNDVGPVVAKFQEVRARGRKRTMVG